MKLKVQAQSLQPGDIVGSGEKVIGIQRSGLHLAKGKVIVLLAGETGHRNGTWGKYTMINVERKE